MRAAAAAATSEAALARHGGIGRVCDVPLLFVSDKSSNERGLEKPQPVEHGDRRDGDERKLLVEIDDLGPRRSGEARPPYTRRQVGLTGRRGRWRMGLRRV